MKEKENPLSFTEAIQKSSNALAEAWWNSANTGDSNRRWVIHFTHNDGDAIGCGICVECAYQLGMNINNVFITHIPMGAGIAFDVTKTVETISGSASYIITNSILGSVLEYDKIDCDIVVSDLSLDAAMIDRMHEVINYINWMDNMSVKRLLIVDHHTSNVLDNDDHDQLSNLYNFAYVNGFEFCYFGSKSFYNENKPTPLSAAEILWKIITTNPRLPQALQRIHEMQQISAFKYRHYSIDPSHNEPSALSVEDFLASLIYDIGAYDTWRWKDKNPDVPSHIFWLLHCYFTLGYKYSTPTLDSMTMLYDNIGGIDEDLIAVLCKELKFSNLMALFKKYIYDIKCALTSYEALNKHYVDYTVKNEFGKDITLMTTKLLNWLVAIYAAVTQSRKVAVKINTSRMKELTGDEIVCELLGLQSDVRIGALVASEADVCNTLAANWFKEDGCPEIFITLYPSTLTVSVRSRGPVRALDVASKYNGGGHVNAAGCLLPLEVFEKLFTEYHTYQQPRESKDSTEEKK